MSFSKTVLILGANSEVAKECIKIYCKKGFHILAASRNTEELHMFAERHNVKSQISVLKFDAEDYSTHQSFYNKLPAKPHLVIYAAGFLAQNKEVFNDFQKYNQMMSVNCLGAASILNIIANDKENKNLERIIGLSSLSGIRGRKSNFMYGSTKAAFQTYLEGLQQELALRNIVVNIIVSGYIDTKINKGLNLNKSLTMKPEFVAEQILNAGSAFKIIPDFRWKIIFIIVKLLPLKWLAKLP